MIPSTMNRKELRKMVNKTFRFVPLPIQVSETGSSESDMNLWIHRGETPDKKGFEFLNAMREHDPFILDHSQIRKYDAPNNLILFGQVIIEGSTVRYEPFHPKPASASTIPVSLRMSMEGADENNSLLITSPPLEPLRFVIENMGEQTVRDYRTKVLIPTAFVRSSSDSYLGNLSQSGKVVKIAKHPYSVYGNFMSQPIYKKERVRIGSLPLKANYGKYNFFWQIRCDDGAFPTERTYGRIERRVVL
jgi:hypothetical protein